MCTTLAGPAPVQASSPELEAQRAAAARGCSIERIVIAADASRGEAADVQELLRRDRDAGLATRVVDAASSLPALDHPLAFAVWDEDVVELDGEASSEPGAVARALAAAGALRDATPLDELVLPEPLWASAPVARRLAPVTCTGCADYHGLIQDLRLLGVVGTPQRNGGFFRDALQSAAEAGARRVHVAGAADYAMLSHVLAAFEAAGAKPEVTVMDRCPTPLLLSRWYAAERGVAIATGVADLRVHVPAEPVELIVTDSLLTLLDPEGRALTLAAWRTMLAPGGRVVTVARVESGSDGPVRPAPGSEEEFVSWVMTEARRRRGLFELDLPDLEAAARRYVHIPLRPWPVSSVDALTELVAAAGLVVESVELHESRGRARAGGVGPGAHRDATFARLVARRP